MNNDKTIGEPHESQVLTVSSSLYFYAFVCTIQHNFNCLVFQSSSIMQGFGVGFSWGYVNAIANLRNQEMFITKDRSLCFYNKTKFKCDFQHFFSPLMVCCYQGDVELRKVLSVSFLEFSVLLLSYFSLM